MEQWGGFLSDSVWVPYAEHMLVPSRAGLEPTAVASASDNLSDAWRTVAPALAPSPVRRARRRRRGRRLDRAVRGRGRRRARRRVGRLRRLATSDADAIAETLGAKTLAETPKRVGPFPITVDASSDPDGLRLALRSTAPDGICTSSAIYFDEQPRLPLLEMYTKGITFHTGRANARQAMPHVLELAASGALRPEAVTTRVVSWERRADALAERDWTKLVISR